jgi:hypothetical protein
MEQCHFGTYGPGHASQQGIKLATATCSPRVNLMLMHSLLSFHQVVVRIGR